MEKPGQDARQEQQRRAVVRTALVLAVVAASSYALFLWTATRAAH